jgi:hypothetical protein
VRTSMPVADASAVPRRAASRRAATGRPPADPAAARQAAPPGSPPGVARGLRSWPRRSSTRNPHRCRCSAR